MVGQIRPQATICCAWSLPTMLVREFVGYSWIGICLMFFPQPYGSYGFGGKKITEVKCHLPPFISRVHTLGQHDLLTLTTSLKYHCQVFFLKTYSFCFLFHTIHFGGSHYVHPTHKKWGVMKNLLSWVSIWWFFILLCRRFVSFSYLWIHLFIYLYHYGLMGIYFILRIRIQCHVIYFFVQIVPTFGPAFQFCQSGGFGTVSHCSINWLLHD